MAFLVILAIIAVLIILIILGIILDLYLGFKVKHRQAKLYSPKDSSCYTELFMEGRYFYDSLKKDIENAKDHIHMSFFIFRYDTIGQEFIDLLIKKAQSGVKICLLIDAVANHAFPKKAVKRLENNGIHFAFSAKTYFPFYFYSLSRRNHRKITVIDGKTGYFGGFNIGDEYLGKKPQLGLWRDYHLKIEGEGVRDLQEQFISDWKQAAKEKIEGPNLYPQLEKGPVAMTLLATDGRQLEEALLEQIQKAKQSIIIGSPYFIPSKKLQQALLERLSQGVNITILLPSKKDHPFVKPASYHYLKPLLEKGGRVYHFYQGFYHAKAFIFDDACCCIGAANFDMRSLIWNDEISGFIYDRDVIKEIENMVKIDFTKSTEVTLSDVNNRSIFEKGKTVLSNALAPLL
ncbi:cardiolipin synthase [Scopulibacillus daqui]|uniref:Cardiolipin synthase n=1 Tax=Scopulibacillus daqui TaxID=1469162 RepID=A0ABS2Q0B5_9BACL|nr:cardiolipin synthase [Scopulibacillus daqui]MBM7645400.1 cardiolipin synthase [Scopulibacillus daqui]